MSWKWRGEVCKKCGKANFVGYDLEDDAWYRITKGFYNILCIPCLDELATKQGIDWTRYLEVEPCGCPMLFPCSTVGWEEQTVDPQCTGPGYAHKPHGNCMGYGTDRT